MGLFYFHLRYEDHLISDDQGLDLPDVAAARHEAIQSAREILFEAIRSGQSSVPDALVVADEAGREIEIVPLVTLLPEQLKK